MVESTLLLATAGWGAAVFALSAKLQQPKRDATVVRTSGGKPFKPQERPERACGTCDGSGKTRCLTCAGLGRINSPDLKVLPRGEWPQWCSSCRGSGRWFCPQCMGSGFKRQPIGFRLPPPDE